MLQISLSCSSFALDPRSVKLAAGKWMDKVTCRIRGAYSAVRRDSLPHIKFIPASVKSALPSPICRSPSCTNLGTSHLLHLEFPTPPSSPCLRQVALPALRREAVAWGLAQMEAVCLCHNNKCLDSLYILHLLLVLHHHRVVLCHSRTSIK